MNRKKLAGLLVCLAAAAVGIGYLTYHYIDLYRKSAIYDTLRQTVESKTGGVQSAPPSGTGPSVSAVSSVPIDFNALQKKNRDIYAWIKIPGTEVDYPIVQSATDRAYYLNHTVEGQAGYPGSIYTENCNARDFSDFNTILYGHDMRNGSMFGGLRNYREAGYLDKHRDVLIYTPKEKRVYRIFAAVVYSDAYLPGKFDFSAESGRQAFLNSIFDNRDMNSQFRKDVPVENSSRILTLSTCIGSQANNRYLIEAVYVGNQ